MEKNKLNFDRLSETLAHVFHDEMDDEFPDTEGIARIIHKFDPVRRKMIGTSELGLSCPEHHVLVSGSSSVATTHAPRLC